MDLQKVLNNVSHDQATAGPNYQKTVQTDLPTLPSIRDSLGEFFPHSYTAYPHALQETGILPNPRVHYATGMPLQLLLETYPQQSPTQSSSHVSVQQQVRMPQNSPDNHHLTVGTSHASHPQLESTIHQTPAQNAHVTQPSHPTNSAHTCILAADQPDHTCTITHRRIGSRFFGFQKRHWGPIPEHIWIHACKDLRSHKCQILLATLDRMQAWGGISHFVLSVRLRELARVKNLRGGSVLPKSAPLVRADGRASAKAKPVPGWLHEHVGAEMGFEEVRGLIGRIRDELGAEVAERMFPDVEFLPVFR